MSTFEMSDMVSDSMVCFSVDALEELLPLVIEKGPEFTFDMMMTLLVSASWDVEVMKIVLASMILSVKEEEGVSS